MIENPKENYLSNEVLEGYLREAVSISGYPLQAVVAEQLQAEFSVTEEWSYLDRTTGEQRSLDIFAWRRLPEVNVGGLLVAPSLLLLIECKRSRHPYVFFKNRTENGRPLAGFPKIAGLQRVELHESSSSCEFAPSECIGLETESFSIGGPPICTSLARAGGKGVQQRRPGTSTAESQELNLKGVELTGSEAYNGALMPLISSLEFLTDYYKPSTSPILPVSALAVCVLDAPMVLSERSPEQPLLSMTPWVRLLRREKRKMPPHGYRHTQHVVDFVHRFALADFVREATTFGFLAGQRLIQKGQLFQKGHGIVTDLTKWQWHEIEPK